MIVILFYLVAAFCEFVAPYDPSAKFSKYKLSPPTTIHLVGRQWRLAPALCQQDHAHTGHGHRAQIYTEDPAVLYPIRLFVRGDEYKLWGSVPDRPAPLWLSV